VQGANRSAVGGPVSNLGNTSPRVWLLVIACAVLGGGVAANLPTGFVVALLALVLIVAVFLWRSTDPMVPFLLLVAAIQGGNLMQVSMDYLPINTLMPVLGGWTLLATLLHWQRDQVARRGSGAGLLLSRSLVALPVVIVLTALAQVWRVGGGLLSLTELLTLIQLGVLVALAAYLLRSPRRVMWMASVTIATGAILSVLTLSGQVDVVTSVSDIGQYGDYARASGLVGDPNYFSFYLLISLAFAASVAMASKTTRGRVLVWLMFVLILAGIVNTYSAGALVGVAAVIGGTILLQFRVSARRALAAFGVIAVATAIVAVMAPPSYREVVQDKYQGVSNGSFQDFGTGRGAAWEAAAREIASNPVMGVGLGGERVMRAIAERYTHDLVTRKAAHNMYLGLAVGTGVVGLGVFLVILGSCCSVLWSAHARAARLGRTDSVVASACLLTALLVVATQGLTISIELEKYTWLIVGACLAVRYWSVEPREDPSAPTESAHSSLV
jgi:O-antigen ligase